MNKMEQFFDGKPPAHSGLHAVVSTTTSNAAAAAWDWVTAVGTTPQGPVWVGLQAQGNDAFVAFRSDNAASVTSTTGVRIPKTADGLIKFWVDPVAHKYIDQISTTGAGTLQLQVCSQIGARNTQT